MSGYFVHTPTSECTNMNPINANHIEVQKTSYDQMFEGALHEILLFGRADLKFVQVNKAARENLGYEGDEILGLSFLDIASEFGRDSFYEQVLPLTDKGAGQLVFETTFRRKDSSTYSAKVQLQLVGAQDAQVFAAFVTDISTRKEVITRNTVIKALCGKVNSRTSPVDFSKHVFNELQRIKPFPNLYVFSYEEIEGSLDLVAAVEGLVEWNGAELNPTFELVRYVAESKEALFLAGEDLKDFGREHAPDFYADELNSWIGIPIVYQEATIGIFVAKSFTEDDPLLQMDVNLFSLIGAQFASLMGREITIREVKQFETYFSLSTDLLCIANTDGYFKKINPRFSELLGYSSEELLSRKFIDYIHPDDVEATLLEVEKLAKGDLTINFVNRYRCADGTYKWLMWSSGVDVKTGLLYSAARDITKQKVTEKILTSLIGIQDGFIAEASSRETFEKVLDVLIEVTDSERGFIGELKHDDRGEPYLYMHALKGITSDINRVSNKESADYIEVLFNEVLKTGRSAIRNIESEASQGQESREQLPEKRSLMALPFYKHKEMLGIVGIANLNREFEEEDKELIEPFLSTCAAMINAYHSALKKQIAEKEVRKLADIVSYSTDAIITTDREDNIVSWNKGAERMFGYAFEEIIGKNIDILRHESLKETHKTIVHEVQKGTSHENYETMLLSKEGNMINVSTSVFPLINDGGQIDGVSRILRDITAQKEAERIKEAFTKELEANVKERTSELVKTRNELAQSLEKEKELGELKSRFVSTTSHQFRTPLAVIQSSIALLAMQKDGMTEEIRPLFDKTYDRVKGQIRRMTDMMNDILLLGKVHGGNLELKGAPTDLAKLCCDIVTNYNDTQKDGRQIECIIQGQERDVVLDPKLMDQAISNLVSNALKYSIGRPAPEVRISYEKDQVEVSVRDFGMGMPEDEVSHLFEPFFRASNATEYAGTGLGTTIAKEYVELHGGKIRVRSEYGKGAEFIITLYDSDTDSEKATS